MARRNSRLTPQSGWALYFRTSSEEAQNPKLSRDRQRFAIESNLLGKFNHPIIDEYVDLESGKNPNRKDYQRMLADARLGRFSHVAVERPDRFGRNDTEALRAIDELHELGVAVRFANQPELDPIDPDDRILVTLSFTLARRESLLMGARIKGGLLAKMREGGCATLAPDGYVNKEERTTRDDKFSNGRHKHWVEPDPDQFKVWREAWDLLLEDRYTLAEICDILHNRGHRFRSGRPFVETRNGRRKHSINTLSKRFHNWFYAGWVVSEKFGIAPKTVKGNWQPVVTTEEFEAGLAILAQRSQKRIPKRRHNYLLSGKIYLRQTAPNLIKLTCSTSNPDRKHGGNPHYRVTGSNINIPCEVVHSQICDLLTGIQVDDRLLPVIRDAYSREIAENLGRLRPSDKQQIQSALKEIDEEEGRALRLFSAGKISETVWDAMWTEWQDRRRTLRDNLENLSNSANVHIEHLDDALNIIVRIGVLFKEASFVQQKALLAEVLEKVIVDAEGNVLSLELMPPFTYLSTIVGAVKRQHGLVTTQTKTTLMMGGSCSTHISACGPEETRTLDLYSAIVALSQLSYRPSMGRIVMLGKRESQG
jgi:DNA invertase Pin-like site-specific DNA recombinase